MIELPARVPAPAKVNLCLYVGPLRDDGLHAICSLFQSVSLADDLLVERGGEADEVNCPGVEGPNLIDAALAAYRAARRGAPAVPPLRVEVEKRIPVAAGVGGGSADAAAALRVIRALDSEPLGERELRAVAMSVGSDVPSQLEPGLAVVTGAGEAIEPQLPFDPYALVLVPGRRSLSTAGVYAEVDRRRADPLGAPVPDPTDPFAVEPRAALSERLGPQLEQAEARLRAALRSGVGSLPDLVANHLGLLRNDLQPAAIALDPEIEEALHALRDAGAIAALVSGSGPTTFGLFGDSAAAERVRAALARRWPRATVALPVTAEEARARPA